MEQCKWQVLGYAGSRHNNNYYQGVGDHQCEKGAARYGCCKRHANQVDDMAQRWTRCGPWDMTNNSYRHIAHADRVRHNEQQALRIARDAGLVV